MSLRPYQQRIVDTIMNELAHYNKPFVVSAMQGCLAGDTRVLTPQGYIAVKDLHEGDLVGSWNGETVEWNRISCKSITSSSLKPKPMLSFSYDTFMHILSEKDSDPNKESESCISPKRKDVLFEGVRGGDEENSNQSKSPSDGRKEGSIRVKTTYDHRFLYDGKYYPLYQLIWGSLEESQRVQLELLCKQYGAPLNYTFERGVSCWDNAPSEGCEGVSSDSDGWADSKSASHSSTELHSESIKQAHSESYQWDKNRQPSIESGMGNPIRTGRTYAEDWTLDKGKVRGHARSTRRSEDNDGRPVNMVMERMGEAIQGCKIDQIKSKNIQRLVIRKQQKIQPVDHQTAKKCYQESFQLSAIQVHEAEDYYSLSVENCHTYIIEGGFPTHNSGKSWMIAEVAKQVGKCLVLCMNKELVEQDAEKIRAVGAECSIYSASCGEKVISNITVATIGSIYKVPKYCMGFDLVIVDECFFAGTKVDGKNIEDYKVGDVVRSYNFAAGKIEKKRVSRVIRKKSPEKMYCIKVSGRSIISTGNHQHYTSSGWKRADEIKEGDIIYETTNDRTSALFDLRENNQTARHEPEPAKTVLPKRKNVLLDYVREGGYRQSLIAKTKRPQSQKQKTGSDTKTITNKKNKGGSTYMDYAPRAKRGERKTQRATKDSLESAGQGMDARSCNTNGATKGHWVSHLLQSRLGECVRNDCNRTRRAKPQRADGKNKRQKEDEVIRELRVDGVEILERKDYGRLGLSDNGDYVYCISVEDNHNFFANGVLTHNCDAAPVDKKDSMYMKLFSQIRKPVIGLTGTAFRTAYNYSRLKNGDVVQSTVIKSLDGFKFWGKVIDGVGYQELLDEKFLSPIQYYVEDTNMSMLRVNSTGLDYTEDSLEKYGGANRMRLVQVVRGAVDVWKCKRVLVAVPNIEEAECVAEMLRADGVRAESLHSQMSKKERTRIVEHFKDGQIKVVVQVLILNVGFDLPALDCVIFARPSLSLRIWCQFVARGIRLDPDDKAKTCKCIDMGGMIKLYGRIEDVKVKGGRVIGTHGYISDKILNKVNVSEMARRFN